MSPWRSLRVNLLYQGREMGIDWLGPHSWTEFNVVGC